MPLALKLGHSRADTCQNGQLFLDFYRVSGSMPRNQVSAITRKGWTAFAIFAAGLSSCSSIRLKSYWIDRGPIADHLHAGMQTGSPYAPHNRQLRSMLQANRKLHRSMPVELHGFAWDFEDFQEIVFPGHYGNQRLKTGHQRDGIGVPVVVVRRRLTDTEDLHKSFLPQTSSFAATAVLSPNGEVLHFFNPVTVRTVQYGDVLDSVRSPSASAEVDATELYADTGIELPLAYDLTSSLAYAMHHHPQTRLQDFVRPDRADDPSKLTMLEPYQSDKIPLILIHGLLSSPDTFGEICNQLRADEDLMQDYQLWVFGYPTGKPFLRSAGELREQLDRVLSDLDPEAENPFLRQSVMAGHSMGGLITKLMISYSGEQVWNSVSRVPLEAMAVEDRFRAQLAQRFYFDPHPMISRAVFIATPHRGSSTAGRAIGKMASALVVQSDTGMQELIRKNPTAIRETLSEGLPTSIDMLDPNQPFLRILNSLQLSEGIPLHSIVGTGGPLFGVHQSDGVVPYDSAHWDGVQSERKVPTTHSSILTRNETVEELQRILREHRATIASQFPDDDATIPTSQSQP